MKKVLVVAPHPDDESLGCGGTLLKHISEGDQVYWLIVTGIDTDHGFSEQRVTEREKEIEAIGRAYPFTHTYSLRFPTTELDTVPMNALVQSFSRVFQEVQPDIIYIPYRGDIHSDHKYVFDAATACTKWFRYPFVKRVLVYETLSETEFGLNPDANGFKPNVFMNITSFLQKKLEIMQIYKSEFAEHPFPRSSNSVEALARYRGSTAGFQAAEAFMLLKEVIE
ncbi:GlcNAc-PI de-N-acetylase [Paenibacillus cisolokensis]|uniref:GlcNAc-PI de-N-acetylase n=1 Tax=Paenibacillus cisolokensis TaxID=1658519 RepID=A0ABQ4N3N7_9BACL|nr:PIG-L deacetylase family protein [Paenibacillus cisolokensis]GIQ62818.1 GlcNAc-PI de-N-acetylase [Paenibacillus cisolokensis]